MEGICHVSTFKTVTKFLLEFAVKEILKGDCEELTQWKGQAGELKKRLLDEMKKYARQQYPFNERLDSNEVTIMWWKKEKTRRQQEHPGSSGECSKFGLKKLSQC